MSAFSGSPPAESRSEEFISEDYSQGQWTQQIWKVGAKTIISTIAHAVPPPLWTHAQHPADVPHIPHISKSISLLSTQQPWTGGPLSSLIRWQSTMITKHTILREKKCIYLYVVNFIIAQKWNNFFYLSTTGFSLKHPQSDSVFSVRSGIQVIRNKQALCVCYFLFVPQWTHSAGAQEGEQRRRRSTGRPGWGPGWEQGPFPGTEAAATPACGPPDTQISKFAAQDLIQVPEKERMPGSHQWGLRERLTSLCPGFLREVWSTDELLIHANYVLTLLIVPQRLLTLLCF